MPTPLEMIRSLGDKAVQGSPHARALGLEFVSAEVGRAILKAPYKDELIGDLESRVIAGGVITALLDHVCGQAVWTRLEGFTSIATLDLRIDYMRAAEPGLDVFARRPLLQADPLHGLRAGHRLRARRRRPGGHRPGGLHAGLQRRPKARRQLQAVAQRARRADEPSPKRSCRPSWSASPTPASWACAPSWPATR